MSDLIIIDKFNQSLLKMLEPRALTALNRKFSRFFRAKNSQRIKQQLTPDGAPFTPRQALNLSPRRRDVRMFKRLRLARNLKARARSDAAVIYFRANVQQVAKVHHFGLREKLKNHSKTVNYPARPLIGFNSSDLVELDQLINQHFSTFASKNKI